jgi:hypothetical protein
VVLPDDEPQIHWFPQGVKFLNGASYNPIEKFMLMMVWNQHGFHLLYALEKGRKLRAMHYITEVLSQLSEWPASGAPERDHKLIVHADNAKRHPIGLLVEFFGFNRMKTVLHPPYSPDIAPFDFYLLAMSKDVRPVPPSWMWRDFLRQFEGFLTVSTKQLYKAVFLGWMHRLRKGIQTNRDYIE